MQAARHCGITPGFCTGDFARPYLRVYIYLPTLKR